MKKHVEEFILWKATHAPVAAKNYKPVLLRLVRGKRDLSAQDVVHFVQNEKERLRSIATTLAAVKNFCSYYQHITGEKIIAPELIRYPRVIPNRRPYLTEENLEEMEQGICVRKFRGLQFVLILRLLWDTGVRISELVAIKLEHIETQNKCAHVFTRKNYQTRYVYWSDHTHELLIQYLGIHLCRFTANTYLFPGSSGGHLNVRTVQRWIKERVEDVGLKSSITPHSFRHGKAHAMIANGATVKEIQVVLGHSETNPQAAFQYLRLDRLEQQKIAQKYI